MPSDAQNTLEPVATTTHCLCENARFGVHDSDCIHRPQEIIKPNPRAGKRAWRNYRKLILERVKSTEIKSKGEV